MRATKKREKYCNSHRNIIATKILITKTFLLFIKYFLKFKSYYIVYIIEYTKKNLLLLISLIYVIELLS
jgi:uncharacterized membrane protein